MKVKAKRRINWKRLIGLVVMVTLVFSIGYAVVMLVAAPNEPVPGEEFRKLKSDYVLMLSQCILGLVVILIPDFLNHRFSFELPNYMFILYYVFLYCAIYLGEVRSFFYLIPHWDTILHGFSGVMLGALGFALVSILNEHERVLVHLSPGFVALFAFCFAVACGAVWEIYEFLGDGVLHMNMQKFRLEDGTLLLGREALSDTMEDIIIDAIGALAVTLLGLFTLRHSRLPKSLAGAPQPLRQVARALESAGERLTGAEEEARDEASNGRREAAAGPEAPTPPDGGAPAESEQQE